MFINGDNSFDLQQLLTLNDSLRTSLVDEDQVVMNSSSPLDRLALLRRCRNGKKMSFDDAMLFSTVSKQRIREIRSSPCLV